MFVRNLEHLKYRNEQYALFGESVPGVWLGSLFLVTGITGIIARNTRNNPERRHVRYTVFATLNLLNTLASTWRPYEITQYGRDYTLTVSKSMKIVRHFQKILGPSFRRH